MTGFELRISGVGSDYSTNSAATIAYVKLFYITHLCRNSINWSIQKSSDLLRTKSSIVSFVIWAKILLSRRQKTSCTFCSK